MERGEQQHPEEPLAIERLTIEELLILRRQLAEDSQHFMEKLDQEIEVLAQRNSTHAADILEALARSEEQNDRDVSAIYVGALLAANKERAIPTLLILLQDKSDDIRRQAFQTLEEAVNNDSLALAEAIPLAQVYFGTKTDGQDT